MYEEDRILVDRIQAGDQLAENELVDKYSSYIENYLYHLVTNIEDREDLIQDAWKVVIRNLRNEHFNLTSALGTFIIGIVKNIWEDRRKKRKRHSEAIIPSYKNVVSGIILPDALKIIENEDFIKKYYQYVESLKDEKTRLILRLFASQTMTFNQIAAIVGLGTKQVENKCYYARLKIRDIFQDKIRVDLKKRTIDFNRIDDYNLLLEAIKHDYRYFDFRLAMAILHDTILNQVPYTESLDVIKLHAQTQQLIIEILTSYGIVEGNAGSINKSRRLVLEYKKINEPVSMAFVKHIEAQGFYILKNLHKALQVYDEAFELINQVPLKSNEHKEVLCGLLRDKGVTQFHAGLYKEGLMTLQQSLNFCEENNIGVAQALAKMRIGEYYINRKHFDKAYSFIAAAEKNISSKFKVGQIEVEKLWTKFYFYQNKIGDGMPHFERALELSEKDGFRSHLLDLKKIKEKYHLP